MLVRSISGSQHLAAFYTVKEGLAVTAETLKAAQRESLPLYMVPDVWKELPEMPQTPGGKTDFGALQREPVEYVRNYRAPSGRTGGGHCGSFRESAGGLPGGSGGFLL